MCSLHIKMYVYICSKIRRARWFLSCVSTVTMLILQVSPCVLMHCLYFQFQCAFQVEGSVVHIMKALARHPGAAQTLAECDRFQYMFHMVVMGGTTPLLSPSRSRSFKSAPPVHLAQLYRHVLQVGHALGFGY